MLVSFFLVSFYAFSNLCFSLFCCYSFLLYTCNIIIWRKVPWFPRVQRRLFNHRSLLFHSGPETRSPSRAVDRIDRSSLAAGNPRTRSPATSPSDILYFLYIYIYKCVHTTTTIVHASPCCFEACCYYEYLLFSFVKIDCKKAVVGNRTPNQTDHHHQAAWDVRP